MKKQSQYMCILLTTAFMVLFFAAQPCLALIVTEIMYHPVEEDGTPQGVERLEFVELYNNRAVTEDLSGCTFTNGIAYTFPSGTTLGAREYIVVAKYPDDVEAAYGITGVHGPFTGILNNNGERIELSTRAQGGRIIISFRYNDGRPWSASPDGTGHSLTLARLGGDPEAASTWAPSEFMGGSPGAPDDDRIAPQEPNMVTLIDIGHPGRFFKGKTEPSPAPGGQPATDWTNISFNDDPATTSWIEGPSGYGYSSNSAELQPVRTILSDMQGGYISLYARLPFTLTAQQLEAFSQLRAEVHYDDAFVLYLNGTRVADSGNIQGAPPPFNQPADSASDYAPYNLDLTSWMNLLVEGTNILAIQVHNSNIGSSSDCLGSPVLTAIIDAPDTNDDDPDARLLINELLTNSESGGGLDWVEVYNPGPVAVDLSNVYLSDGRFDLVDNYRFPDGLILQPGEFADVDQAALGFGLSSTGGETVFLTLAGDDPQPKPLRVLDAVRFGTVEADVTLGRYPNGDDNIVALSSPTRGASNAQPLQRDIVINEIMYHHGLRDPRYEYIEIYNRSDSPVSLTGWAFTDGVDYEFPPGTTIGAHSCLVIANDPDFIENVYPNLRIGINLFGPYNGGLDDHSERIRLSLPAVEIDPDTGKPYPITADEVTYCDGGRWPVWADGQGSSLELIDPDSNNDSPDAWAPSDETGKAPWQQLSFIIEGSDPDYTHSNVNIFGLMMLNRGEVLIDDIELKIGNSNRLTNAGFESGESSWRILGNHVQSFITTEGSRSGTKSLHLVATGHGDPGANRINQSFSGTYAGAVEFRFWARWLKGSRHLLMRVTQEQSPRQPPWPAHAFELAMPLNQGTPGIQNSAYLPNRGPDISDVRHAPVLPAGNEPIVVTAQAADNDGVSTVTLKYRSEGQNTFTAAAMTDDGSGSDALAGDGIFTAAIPGAFGGTMRAFYIEASDGEQITRFPTRLPDSADVPDRTCLVRVGDAKITTALATYRVWMSNDVVNTFTSRANLSNELMDCTFVYNNTDVFYNARIRFRGSPFLRRGTGRNPTGRYAYRLDFNSDQKFHGRDEINLDNTESGSRGPLQERASYWFYRRMGLQYSTQEYVRPILNGNAHLNYEDVHKIDGDYVDAWFPDDNNGYIHKIDDYFEYNAGGTNKSNLDEGLKHDAAHPLIKETYRWGFEKRSHREADDWDHIFHFAEMMNTPSNSPDYEANVESVIHPEHFARVLAIRHAVGDWDSYGYSRGKNNYFYYASDEQKWYLLPWDIDFTLGSGNGTTTNLFSVTAGEFPEVKQFMDYPKYNRMFWQAFAELVHGPWRTSYGTANPPTDFDRFLDDASAVLIAEGGGDGRRDGIKSFVRGRRNYILPRLPSSPAFEVTTTGGFCTSDATITIKGVAPIQVGGIASNGAPVEAYFEANNSFQAHVPLQLGVNNLLIQGITLAGTPVEGAAHSMTVTRVLPTLIQSVTPATICNNGTAELTIYGSGFEPGSPLTVVFSSKSEEIGFDALYVKSDSAFDQIDAASVLLDDPSAGAGDETLAVHTHINLYNSGTSHGEFPDNEQNFAAPYDSDSTNYAVRFTGYIFAPSPGVRYFGVNSNEGFTLSIDGQLVGEYADIRPAATTDAAKNRTAGTMSFDFPSAGSYYLVLDYFENSGAESLEFFQTDSSGNNRRLINVNSELVVFRDNAARIDAADVIVVDSETITCTIDADQAPPGFWDVIITPSCGFTARATMPDALQLIYPPNGPIEWTVTPDARADFFGIEGGPFSPTQVTFVVANTGKTRLNWSIAKAAPVDWIDLPYPRGTLTSGRTKSVTLRLNSAAAQLPLGAHNCPLVFSVGCNSAGPSTYQRQVRLTVTYPSDFNGDATVDAADLTAIAEKWLLTCSQPIWCAGTDLDQSQRTDLADLAIFASQWLLTVP